MTKEEIIGGAYLKLTGGYPNMDSTTWWEDVDLLLAPAVNFVMNGDYFLTKRDELEEKIIQPLFVQTYKNIDITFDNDLELKVFTLPKKPLALPKLRSITYIGDNKGNAFVPIEQGGNQMQKYYHKFKECQTSYDIQGMQVFLYYYPALLKKAMVRMVVSASDLADTDEVMLPDGGELRVMDLMVQFFIGERQLPKDYLNTGKEPNLQQ